jgi:alkylation response protein AidB-like acyl-CoA dehydrogenase
VGLHHFTTSLLHYWVRIGSGIDTAPSTDRPFEGGYNAGSTINGEAVNRRRIMEHFPWWNEAHKKLKQEAQQLVDEVLLPSALRSMKRSRYAWDAVRVVADKGWFGALVPEKYGGMYEQLGVTGSCIISEELSRAGGLASAYGGTAFGAVHQIMESGSEEQKQRWLPKLAKGELFGAITMTEPYAGSDIASLETSAERDGDGYIVNGIKRFQTGAGAAHLYMTYAQTSDDPEVIRRHGHLTGVMIERGMPGFHVERFNEWSGAAGSYNCYLRFDQVKVPPENVIGEEGEGWNVMMAGVNVERILNASYYLGSMRESIRYAKQHLDRRVQFGRPTGSIAVNQFKLADMYTKLQMSRLLVYYAAHCADQGVDVPVEAAMAKLVGSESAFEVAREAIQCMGGNGCMHNLYPTAGLLSGAKQAEIAAGTSEIMRLLIYRMADRAYAPHLQPYVRAYDEELAAVLPVGRPEPPKPVSSETDVLQLLAEEYRVNPGLHMTPDDIRKFLEVEDDDLANHLETLEEQGLVSQYRDRRGRARMARATVKGIKQAFPPEHYQHVPDWVRPEDTF